MKKFTLYKHNQQAYEAIKEAFLDGQQIASIVQATGTGKTFVAINLAKEEYPKKMLFISPTNAIIEHVQEIIRDYGLDGKVNIEFITYSSLINKSSKELADFKFDYLVVDEFHHMGAPIWGQRVTDLINSHENAHVLGMSAYTIRDKGTAFAMDVAPTIIGKMTDESIDEAEEPPIFADSIVHRYDLADALIDGVLKQPKYIFSQIKLHAYAATLKDKVENSNCTKEEKEKYTKELNSIMSNLIMADDTKKLLRESVKPSSKCIYFVPIGMTNGVRNIERAKEILAEIFPDAIIYSTTSDDKFGEQNRDAFYNDKDLSGKDVSGKLRIMVAINQYNEGVHAQDVDTVILGRATQSNIVFFEQLGRALSVSNSSTPLCIDLSGNLDYILSLSAEIGDRIKVRYEATGLNPKLDRDLPTFDFGLDSFNIQLLERLQEIDDATENWNARFEQLKTYLQKHNRYPRSTDESPEIKKLGKWVEHQRYNYKSGKLADDRIRKLQSINFIFQEKEILPWNEMFNKLVKYINENGKYPQQTDADPEIRKLSKWVEYQRQNYKSRKLPDDKIRKLQSINFIFQEKEKLPWDEMFNKLVKYINENGKYPQRTDADPEIRKLSIWINNLRVFYRSNKLPIDKIKKLQSIGFIFDPFEESWQVNFNELVKYLEENNGKYPPKSSKLPKVKRLAIWVGSQRLNYKNKILSKEKLAKLQSIGFIFDSQEESWQINLDQLTEYLKVNDGKYPSADDPIPEIRKISAWVFKQRKSYNKKQLPANRLDKLQSIGFVFDPHEENWQNTFNRLVKYINENNGKFPSSRDSDPNIKALAIWISKQRAIFRNNDLSQDRTRKLQEIGVLEKTDSVPLDPND